MRRGCEAWNVSIYGRFFGAANGKHSYRALQDIGLKAGEAPKLKEFIWTKTITSILVPLLNIEIRSTSKHNGSCVLRSTPVRRISYKM